MNTQDKKIAEIFQSNLPEAGRDEWFVRKVLNRLPARHRRMSPIELGCIIAACIALVVAFVIEGATIIHSQQLLVRDVVFVAALTLMSLGVVGWIVSPYLKN